MFFDLREHSPNGPFFNEWSFSDDGSQFIYTYVESDFLTTKIRKVDSGKDCDEVMTSMKASVVTWAHDNTGFFYFVR